MSSDLTPKGLQLLKETLPAIHRVAMLRLHEAGMIESTPQEIIAQGQTGGSSTSSGRN